MILEITGVLKYLMQELFAMEQTRSDTGDLKPGKCSQLNLRRQNPLLALNCRSKLGNHKGVHADCAKHTFIT